MQYWSYDEKERRFTWILWPGSFHKRLDVDARVMVGGWAAIMLNGTVKIVEDGPGEDGLERVVWELI